MRVFILILFINGQWAASPRHSFVTHAGCMDWGSKWRLEHDKLRKKQYAFMCESALFIIIDGKISKERV